MAAHYKSTPICDLRGTEQGAVYHGGPLLRKVRPVAIYWGDAWTTDTTHVGYRNYIDEFLQFVVTSPLIDQLNEYDVDGFNIGHGHFEGSHIIPSSFGNYSNLVQDRDVQDVLDTLQNSNKIPPNNPNRLYLVFVPSDVQVHLVYQQYGYTVDITSCEEFCAYHLMTISGMAYGVIPVPMCVGCHGFAPSIEDAITIMVSHELCEAITNPAGTVLSATGTGWYFEDGNASEIGDPCQPQSKQLGPWLVQKIWSNQAQGCI